MVFSVTKPAVLVTTMMLLGFFPAAHASLCGTEIEIEADQKEVVEKGHERYQGNVVIRSGSVLLRSNALFVGSDASSSMRLRLNRTIFTVDRPGHEVYGTADFAVLHWEGCLLDLFGAVEISAKSQPRKSKDVRYFINSDDIQPLLLFVDQRIPIVPADAK